MPKHFQYIAQTISFAVATCFASAPALAHHPMGGATPATFAQGLLSGLGHPVIGLDHLAALIGVGLISARFAGGIFLAPVWIVAMALGVGVHIAGLDLPLAESLVALSVIAIGITATLRSTLPFWAAVSLFVAGGIAHGHVLTEAIIGAQAGPLVAYLIGLVAVQSALVAGIALLTSRFWNGPGFELPARARIAGVAVTLIGLAALARALPSGG